MHRPQSARSCLRSQCAAKAALRASANCAHGTQRWHGGHIRHSVSVSVRDVLRGQRLPLRGPRPGQAARRDDGSSQTACSGRNALLGLGQLFPPELHRIDLAGQDLAPEFACEASLNLVCTSSTAAHELSILPQAAALEQASKPLHVHVAQHLCPQHLLLWDALRPALHVQKGRHILVRRLADPGQCLLPPRPSPERCLRPPFSWSLCSCCTAKTAPRPSHVKRDFNQRADELTHPGYQGSLRIVVSMSTVY